MDECGFFCNTIYKDNCTFYIQDNKQRICEIWTMNFDTYEQGCTKHEGPKSPLWDPQVDSPTGCENDKCKAYKESYCMFEGDLLEHLNSIPDEKTCQQACAHVPNCKYYIWDKNDLDCQLLDSSSRQCDQVKVKAGAEQTFDDCNK